MKFIFLGMGAVGSLWASIMYENGYKIIGLCRGKHYEEISKRGLQFKNLKGSTHTIKLGENFQVFNSSRTGKNLLKTFSDEDWVIITSKAYNLVEIAEDYKDFLSNHGSVLLLQNGIGNEDIIKKRIPKMDIYRGTTTMGAFLVNPGFVQHTGMGFTKLGYPHINYQDESTIPENTIAKIKNLVKIFNNLGIKTEYNPNIDVVLWEKIFVNIGINAPAAIRNILNGDLLQSSEIMNQMKRAITEAWEVGRAMNISLDDTPDRYIELTYDVARKTAKNKNSMLQDLMRGKPTEIDFINGKIIDYARRFNIDVPENEKLTQKVKELEHRRSK